MKWVKEIRKSLWYLWFPYTCAGCGHELVEGSGRLCIRCSDSLPATDFHDRGDNPVEKMFWGRLPLVSATAAYYFTKESLMQRLVHRFKYQGDQELGLQLGRMLGKYLRQSGRFNADAIVPLPLFTARERKRGYNQATILCEGIAEILELPVLNRVVVRKESTTSQTKKGRIERWANMQGKFEIKDAAAINHKYLLLVDDVITTGATLEACGTALLKGEKVSLSIATLCVASY